MKYPLYVHKDEGTVYGAQFLDVPDVFTHGETLEDIEHNAQEAIECRFLDSGEAVPSPTQEPAKLHASDLEDGQGFWIFVDIDTSKLKRAIRLNISLPGGKCQEFRVLRSVRNLS